MKKLILFFTVAMVAVAITTGCTIVDRSCYWYYRINNQTGADIVVEVGHRETAYQSRLIKSYYEETIYDRGGGCEEDEDVFRNYPEEPIGYDAITYMKIDGKYMSNAILKGKYWTLFKSKHNSSSYFCVMTLTNELLEELRQQDESSN